MLNNQVYSLPSEKSTKALEVRLNTNDDSFFFKTSIKPFCRRVTKRYVLSVIAQIFVTFGLIGPIFTNAEIILQ